MFQEKRKSKFASTGNPKIQRLIRAAEFANEREKMHVSSENEERLEEIGVIVNILRRKRNISLEAMAERMECEVEELIALEAGFLSCDRVCKILPIAAANLGINYGDYLPDAFKFLAKT